MAGYLKQPSGGGGGVSDHGGLTGLEDDDHPQYLTTVAAAAGYAPLATYLKADGSVAFSGDLLPSANAARAFGSATLAMTTVFTAAVTAGTTSASAITFSSTLIAGSTSTDFVFNSTTTRSAGLLMSLSNNSSLRFSIEPDGDIVPVGDILMPSAKTIKFGGSTVLSFASTRTQLSGITSADGGINLQSRVSTANSSNPDLIINSDVTRTAGAVLISLRNNGTQKMSWDEEGRMKWIAGNAQTTVGAAGAATCLPGDASTAIKPTRYLKVIDSDGVVLVVPAFLAA